MGVPAVLIHLIFGFSITHHPAIGYPHLWKPLSGDEAKPMNHEAFFCARMRSREAKQGVKRVKMGMGMNGSKHIVDGRSPGSPWMVETL